MPPSPFHRSHRLRSARACSRLQTSLGYSNRLMAAHLRCSLRQWIRWKQGTSLPWRDNLERLSAMAVSHPPSVALRGEFAILTSEARKPKRPSRSKAA